MDTGVCPDEDNDGHRSASCGGDDCDDRNPSRNPANREVCDDQGLDEDCDPCTVAEVTGSRLGGDGDRDRDGFVSTACFNRITAGAARPVCSSTVALDAGAGDGGALSSPSVTVSATEVRGTDCADDPAAGGAARYPGAAELCNDVDDNCVAGVMDETRTAFYRDRDGDGFGDRSAMGADIVMACAAPMGFVAVNSDCNDNSATVNPGAREVCDALANIDENCNGNAEEGCMCPSIGATRACCGGRGAETCGDTGMGATWGACSASVSAETCNGVDDNCDGSVDEGLTVLCFRDADNDGFAAVGATAVPVCPDSARAMFGSCPIRYTNRAPMAGATDCDDALDTRAPGRAELCDGVDNDCDAATADDANDTTIGAACTATGAVGRCRMGTSACGPMGLECRPGAALPELCNGVDDDCDGSTDEALCVDSQSAPTGYGACSAGACQVSACVDGRGDCDANASNGCETNLSNDVDHCGGCGVRCIGAACVSGVCVGAAVVEVATGREHACVRDAGGRVLCWGRNALGQVGDGTTVARLRPVAVNGLVDAVEISAGDTHTCARRATGEVVCWGGNTAGQLGDGGFVNRSSPTTVLGVTDAVEISVGRLHTCARRSNGQVFCWGYNAQGQLGDGTTTSSSAPLRVAAVNDAVEITAGSLHTCARRADGQVRCWGANSAGQLGDGTTTDRLSPVLVTGLSDAVQISAGGVHTCARRASGQVLCWGSAALSGISLATVTDAVEIESGLDHSCARRSNGQLVCWGENLSGQLGDGTNVRPLTVVSVSGLTDAVEIEAGTNHSCARRSNGDSMCWGANGSGQLGDTTTIGRNTPTLVSGL